jgi:hypothetical protein
MDVFTRDELVKAFAASMDEGHVSLKTLLVHLIPGEWAPFEKELVYDMDNDRYMLVTETMAKNWEKYREGFEPVDITWTRFRPMLELIRRIGSGEESLPDLAARNFIEENYKKMGFPFIAYNAEEDL